MNRPKIEDFRIPLIFNSDVVYKDNDGYIDALEKYANFLEQKKQPIKIVERVFIKEKEHSGDNFYPDSMFL